MASTDRSRAVLVTGCSSGIGRATALTLARQGWTVWATARRPETLADLAAAGCRTLALDVTDEDSMRAAVAAIEREHGAVAALINNAGYSQSGALEELEPARLRRQFETNVFGLLRLTQLVLPGMRRQGWGRVVNIGSIAGRLTFPGGGAYHATKHAVEALSDALRWEVEAFGIDVVLVQPGLIRSGFTEAAVASIASRAEGPYADFDAAVARTTADTYVKGPLSLLTGESADVARVVARALSARRPRTRYAVSGSAYLLLALRRLLTDRLWDRAMRLFYPRPGAARAPAAEGGPKLGAAGS